MKDWKVYFVDCGSWELMDEYETREDAEKDISLYGWDRDRDDSDYGYILVHPNGFVESL